MSHAGAVASPPLPQPVPALSPAGAVASPPLPKPVPALSPAGAVASPPLPQPCVRAGHHDSEGLVVQAPFHLLPPSREEFNNHRLNILEVSFLQSQRTSLLESKISQQCNFKLDLPSITEYEKLPVEASGSAQVSIASIKQLPGGSFSTHQLQLKKDIEDDDDVCHCGLLPVLHTIQAAGADFGRQFFSCIQKEDEQCSFFKWKKVIPQKV